MSVNQSKAFISGTNPYNRDRQTDRKQYNVHINYTNADQMKKALRGDANTALAAVRRSQKIFSPAADPLLGGAGRPKSNQLEMVTTFTYRPLVKIDARNFELSW